MTPMNADEAQEGLATTDRIAVRGGPGLPKPYGRACDLVQEGKYQKARWIFRRLADRASTTARLRALIHNDLAVLDVIEGRHEDARHAWTKALEIDGGCLQAASNRDLFEAEMSLVSAQGEHGEHKLEFLPDPRMPSQAKRATEGLRQMPAHQEIRPPDTPRPAGGEGNRDEPSIRVAILSFLFNWPSTGGGNMHTAGLAEFLGRAGYEVRHYFARFPAWGIGRVNGEEYLRGAASAPHPASGHPLPATRGEGVAEPRLAPASEPLEFIDAEWNVGAIQAKYRRSVDAFAPDYVVITDTWNMKPHLADAMRGYPTLLLFQAHECLCPLNNLRLLGVGPMQVEQCPRNQLATPEICRRCLAERAHHSGALHQAERQLAGVGTAEYDQKLRRSLQEAEAVLALNPVIAAMLEPFSSRVCIVPWGIDPARFALDASWEGEPPGEPQRPTRLFMAAVAGEFIKGYVSVRQFQGGARLGASKRRANAALFDMLCDQGSGVALQYVTAAGAGSHGAGLGAGLCDATPRGGEPKHALGAPEPTDPGASRPPNPDARPPRAVG
jgi:hypothetical protein